MRATSTAELGCALRRPSRPCQEPGHPFRRLVRPALASTNPAPPRPGRRPRDPTSGWQDAWTILEPRGCWWNRRCGRPWRRLSRWARPSRHATPCRRSGGRARATSRRRTGHGSVTLERTQPSQQMEVTGDQTHHGATVDRVATVDGPPTERSWPPTCHHRPTGSAASEPHREWWTLWGARPLHKLVGEGGLACP